MKKYFITGLVILLPLALTAIIVMFLFNLLTEPFVGFFSSLLSYYGLPRQGFLFLGPEQLQLVLSRFLILLLIVAVTFLLGVLARLVLMHYIIRLWESIVNRIPVVRTIYKTCQDVIKTIFTSESNSFKKVVLVKFPHDGTYCVGLVTREHITPLPERLGLERIAVFVPTTPNPTSGFLVLFPPEDVIPLDMSVEDGLKYVISCGVISTPFTTMPGKI